MTRCTEIKVLKYKKYILLYFTIIDLKRKCWINVRPNSVNFVCIAWRIKFVTNFANFLWQNIKFFTSYLHLFWCSDLSLTYSYKQSCIKAKYMAANISCILRHLSLSQNFCNPINRILLFRNSNAKKTKKKKKVFGCYGRSFWKTWAHMCFPINRTFKNSKLL